MNKSHHTCQSNEGAEEANVVEPESEPATAHGIPAEVLDNVAQGGQQLERPNHKLGVIRA